MVRIVLIIVATLAILTGCGAGSAPMPIPEPTVPPLLPEGPLPVDGPPGDGSGAGPLPGEGAGPRPPLLTLATGRGTQEGQIGTYCWSGGGQGLCVDAMGVIVPVASIEAAPESTWTLALAGAQPAQGALRIHHWGEPEMVEAEAGWVAFRPDRLELVERVDLPIGNDWRIETAMPLAPGEYLVEVAMQWPGNAGEGSLGDAVYGFHLRVP